MHDNRTVSRKGNANEDELPTKKQEESSIEMMESVEEEEDEYGDQIQNPSS